MSVTVLVAIVILLKVFIVKMLIDINALVLELVKDDEVYKKPNEFQKIYLFIKGLY